MKKISSLLLATILIISMMVSAFAVTLDREKADLKAGTLHTIDVEYKYSWLNKLVIRDDASAVLTARMVPHAAYPYSRTYEEFILDIESFMEVHDVDAETINDSYLQVINILYYTAVAMGMTADENTMYAFVQKQGIKLPVNPTSDDKVKIAVVYATLKYKLTYVLYEKEVEFTKGTSLEGACIDIISTVIDMDVPSSVKTMEGLALYSCQRYAETFDNIPMSANPSGNEIFYLIKMIASNKAGYSTPVVDYETATDVQREYVDMTYYATILSKAYDVEIDPLALAKANEDNDVHSIARLVLETMLEQGKVSYKDNTAVENLFAICCKHGFFDMDEEFYSDVFNYDVYVDRNCEKLWITPFALANQIGGDEKNVSIKANKVKMRASETKYVPLDTKKNSENVVITLNYNDGNGNSDMTIYALKVIKEEPNKTTSQSTVVSKIEDMLADVVPQDSEKAQEVVSSVVSAADGVVNKAEEVVSNATLPSVDIGSYATIPDTTYNLDVENDKNTTVSGFDYFGDLVDATYKNHDELTSKYNYAEGVTKSNTNNFITNAVETVKESPEIVVAPTSVIAAGVLAGYLFTRRKKTTEEQLEDNNNIED